MDDVSFKNGPFDERPLEDGSRRARSVVLQALAGGVVGLAVGWLVGRLVKMHRIPDLSWSDLYALTIAVAFLSCGLVMAAFTANSRGRAILASPSAPEFGRPVAPGQTTFFLLQAGVLILAGAMLAAPIGFGWIGRDAQAVVAAPLMAGVLVCFALQSVLNWLIWRRADEVFRQVIAEAGALSFWLLQGLFFLWAAGVKCKVLPEVSSWDAVTVLMGAYLVLSTVVAYRRGLG